MNIIKTILKLVVVSALGFLFFLLVDFSTGEILVRWYISKYQVTQRIELKNDLGFGMLAGGLFLINLVVFFPLGVYLSWRLLKRKNWIFNNKFQSK